MAARERLAAPLQSSVSPLGYGSNPRLTAGGGAAGSQSEQLLITPHRSGRMRKIEIVILFPSFLLHIHWSKRIWKETVSLFMEILIIKLVSTIFTISFLFFSYQGKNLQAIQSRRLKLHLRGRDSAVITILETILQTSIQYSESYWSSFFNFNMIYDAINHNIPLSRDHSDCVCVCLFGAPPIALT